MAKSVSKRQSPKVLPVVPVVGAALAGAAARSVAGKAVGKAAGKAAKETIARATKLKNEARATVSANLKKARVMSNPGVKKYYYKQVNDALKMVSQANAQLRKLQKNIGK